MHIVEQVVESKDRQAIQSKMRDFVPYLQNLMNKIHLATEATPSGVLLNSYFIRLVSCISIRAVFMFYFNYNLIRFVILALIPILVAWLLGRSSQKVGLGSC